MGEFDGFMKLNYIVDFFKKHDKNILPEWILWLQKEVISLKRIVKYVVVR